MIVGTGASAVNLALELVTGGVVVRVAPAVIGGGVTGVEAMLTCGTRVLSDDAEPTEAAC